MSPRTRIILAAVGALVVCALFFLLLVRPRSNELGRVRDDVQQAEEETVQLRQQLALLQELKRDAPRVQAALAEIREKVPETNEVPNFIFQVQQAANSSGVGFVQISPELPKPPPEGATVAQVRATIGAKGGYFAVQDFIRRLTRLDRAVRIDNLTISGIEDEAEARERGRTDLQVAARIFFELPPSGVSGAVPGEPAPSPSPTPSP